MNAASQEPLPEPRPTGHPARWLSRAAILTIVLFAAAAGLRLVAHLENGSIPPAAAIGECVLFIAVGLLAAAALVGVGSVLALLAELRDGLVRVERYQYELGQRTDRASAQAEAAKMDTVYGMSLDPPGDASREPAPRERPASSAAELPWRELIQALHEIRDNTLLSDSERHAKKARFDEEQWRLARELIDAALRQRDFVAARRTADDMARRYPGRPDADALIAEIESARERAETGDVAAVTKQINDLINISAWQRARDLAGQLHQRHPDSTEARQLMLRIEREFSIAQTEQQRRMYAEVQRYVSRRRWEEALAAARTFNERFPQSADAEALRLQLPTLEANAEIEVRQQLEAQIMDLARHGRYIQAAELARQVIARYPGSPQADALRSQLPRLDELANNPSAPPARIRLE